MDLVFSPILKLLRFTNSNRVVKWLQYNFGFITESILLLLDEFTGHKT